LFLAWLVVSVTPLNSLLNLLEILKQVTVDSCKVWRWQVWDLWDTGLCNLIEVGRRFRGAYWRQHQGDSARLHGAATHKTANRLHTHRRETQNLTISIHISANLRSWIVAKFCYCSWIGTCKYPAQMTMIFWVLAPCRLVWWQHFGETVSLASGPKLETALKMEALYFSEMLALKESTRRQHPERLQPHRRENLRSLILHWYWILSVNS
jgi:hypothetical protein